MDFDTAIKLADFLDIDLNQFKSSSETCTVFIETEISNEADKIKLKMLLSHKFIGVRENEI